jgi:inorganic pyrophosphatase
MPSTKKPKVTSPSQFRPHPWHGLEIGPEPPEIVNAFIEISPFDLVKYEVDKQSGYMRVDRPQRGSSQPPALYGFIPRTYCGEKFRRLSRKSTRGDGDPLDISVLSERPIARGEILVSARVIGGFQMIDNSEADDKIIAVLYNDYIYGSARDIDDVPPVLIERLRHYFETYKLVPERPSAVSIERAYGRAHALKVVRAAIQDYNDTFSGAAPLAPKSHSRPHRDRLRTRSSTRSA